MNTRTRNAAILGVLIASAIGAGVYVELHQRPPAIVDVLPRNAALVIEIDLATLRRSPSLREAFEQMVQRPLETKSRCAGELLRGLDRLGVAVPAGSGFEDDFVIVGIGEGRGALRAKDVEACAAGAVKDRGGAPITLKQGGFTTVQDGDGTHGVLAIRDRGPLVLGRGPWLSAVVDVADGVAKSLKDDVVHDVARRSHLDAFITLTYALPEEMRRELVSQLPKGTEVLSKVPSLVAALRLDEADGGTLCLEAEAACAADACAELGKLAEGAREMLSHDPRASLLGVRDDLEHATIVVEPSRVLLTVRVKVARVQAIWSQLQGDSPVVPTLPSGHPEPSALGPLDPPSTASTSASTSASP